MPESNETATPGAKIDVNLQSSPDFIIQDLVQQVNGTKAEIPITLMMGGILVTGRLVSVESYYEYLKTEIAAVCKEDQIVRSVQSKCKAALEKMDASPESEQKSSPAPKYMHLKKAQYLMPGQESYPKHGGIWWRGSISEVDGFNLEMLPIQGLSVEREAF